MPPTLTKWDYLCSNVYLLDSQRHIRGIYDTQNAKQRAFLVQDVKKLAKAQ
jgi:hypothetical protein